MTVLLWQLSPLQVLSTAAVARLRDSSEVDEPASALSKSRHDALVLWLCCTEWWQAICRHILCQMHTVASFILITPHEDRIARCIMTAAGLALTCRARMITENCFAEARPVMAPKNLSMGFTTGLPSIKS